MDRYSLDVDGGQTVTLLVATDNDLQATVEWFDPQGTSLGSTTAVAAGAESTGPLASGGMAGTEGNSLKEGFPGSPGGGGVSPLAREFIRSSNWSRLWSGFSLPAGTPEKD